MYFRQGSEIEVFVQFLVANGAYNMANRCCFRFTALVSMYSWPGPVMSL